MKLHRKHGLNPTMPVCFVCGEEKGEIALLGAAYNGEAPRRMCIDKEPCDKCKKLAEQGVLMVVCKDNGQRDNPERTGQMIVLKEEAFIRIFGKITSRICFIEESLKEKLFKGGE